MAGNYPFQQFLGSVIAQPPCRMLNANMYGFFVKGNKHTIQTYLDNTLNIVDQNVQFKALSGFVLLTFTDIENIASITPPFSEQGWMQETDVIVWLPVALLKNNKIDHIYWYPAFITVNNIYALINGRETWGYNKYLCKYEMPKMGQEPTQFKLWVDAFSPFNPNNQMSQHLLLEVNRTCDGERHDFSDLVDLFKQAITLLSAQPDICDYDFNAIKQFIKALRTPSMDQVLFKQFPNGNATQSVYQAVMSSPSLIKKIHSGSIYTHKFDVVIHEVDTFPLAEMFGLQQGPQQALLPFNILMDFNQAVATELAERGIAS